MATGVALISRKGARPRASEGRRRPFWIVMMRSIQIAACVDLMFFFLFYAFGSPILAWVNVISISMYAVAYACMRRRRNIIAVCLLWAEVLGHAALGTLMVGWDSAFHYYLLMFIPAIFVSTKTVKAAVFTFILWCFYLGLNAYSNNAAPIEPLPPAALAALRYFNISVVFAMFAYLSSYYYRTILAAEKSLNKLATTDPLTGLYNRRHITDVANYEAVQQKRSDTGLSFIIGDIDNFKRINDTHGHEVGDSVLIAVSTAIAGATREQDSAARWGGEEFLVVLPNTDIDNALLVAERIREKVAAVRLLTEKETIQTSITLGVASLGPGETIGDAIGRADHALYDGKHAGKNRVVLAEPPVSPAAPAMAAAHAADLY